LAFDSVYDFVVKAARLGEQPVSGASPCYICESPITVLALDPRDMKTKPCSTCLTIVAELVNDQEDDDFIAYIEDDGGLEEFVGHKDMYFD
jgi:hypothetical protein